MQDLFACLRKNVCHGDELEPHLQTMTEEVLTSTASLFGCQCTRLSVTRQRAISLRKELMLKYGFLEQREREKRHYNQRIIEVEHGSLSPLMHMVEMQEEPSDFSLN